MVFILDIDYENLPVPENKVLRMIDSKRHEELEVLTSEFLANGGFIEQLPPGAPPKKRKYRKTDFNPFGGLVDEAHKEH